MEELWWNLLRSRYNRRCCRRKNPWCYLPGGRIKICKWNTHRSRWIYRNRGNNPFCIQDSQCRWQLFRFTGNRRNAQRSDLYPQCGQQMGRYPAQCRRTRFKRSRNSIWCTRNYRKPVRRWKHIWYASSGKYLEKDWGTGMVRRRQNNRSKGQSTFLPGISGYAGPDHYKSNLYLCKWNLFRGHNRTGNSTGSSI